MLTDLLMRNHENIWYTAGCEWIENPRSFSTFHASKRMGLLSKISISLWSFCFPYNLFHAIFLGPVELLVVHTNYNTGKYDFRAEKHMSVRNFIFSVVIMEVEFSTHSQTALWYVRL